MDATENVTISAERLAALEAAERMLAALEAAGVDNWIGHELALEQLAEEEE